MKTDIEVIDGAIELISGDGAWCKHDFCQNANGLPADPASEVVAKYCLEGAIGVANGYLTSYIGEEAPNVWVAPLREQWERVCELAATRGTPEDFWEKQKAKGFPVGVPLPRTFNDDDSTTQEDAILALKQTRSFLEEQS